MSAEVGGVMLDIGRTKVIAGVAEILEDYRVGKPLCRFGKEGWYVTVLGVGPVVEWWVFESDLGIALSSAGAMMADFEVSFWVSGVCSFCRAAG